MPLRMLVPSMGQRTADGPQRAAFRQLGQVLADLKTGRSRGNRFELAPNLDRRVRLHVKGLVLGKTAGKKNIDDRFRATSRSGGRHARFPRGRLKHRQMILTEPQQTDRARLQHGTAGQAGMFGYDCRTVHEIEHREHSGILRTRKAEIGGCVGTGAMSVVRTREPDPLPILGRLIARPVYRLVRSANAHDQAWYRKPWRAGFQSRFAVTSTHKGNPWQTIQKRTQQ